MKKKIYEQPTLEVLNVALEQMIAASPVEIDIQENYTDELPILSRPTDAIPGFLFD